MSCTTQVTVGSGSGRRRSWPGTDRSVATRGPSWTSTAIALRSTVLFQILAPALSATRMPDPPLSTTTLSAISAFADSSK